MQRRAGEPTVIGFHAADSGQQRPGQPAGRLPALLLGRRPAVGQIRGDRNAVGGERRRGSEVHDSSAGRRTPRCLRAGGLRHQQRRSQPVAGDAVRAQLADTEGATRGHSRQGDARRGGGTPGRWARVRRAAGQTGTPDDRHGGQRERARATERERGVAARRQQRCPCVTGPAGRPTLVPAVYGRRPSPRQPSQSVHLSSPLPGQLLANGEGAITAGALTVERPHTIVHPRTEETSQPSARPEQRLQSAQIGQGATSVGHVIRT